MTFRPGRVFAVLWPLSSISAALFWFAWFIIAEGCVSELIMDMLGLAAAGEAGFVEKLPWN